MRRLLAVSGVLLAAFASLATSPRRWEFVDSRAGTLALDDAKPIQTVHVTIHATHVPELSVSADLKGGEARLAVIPDDGSPAVVGTVTPVIDEAGKTTSALKIHERLPAPSCSPPCSLGYTLRFERAPNAGTRVEIGWQALAEVRGIGETPPGAGVAVRSP